MKLTHLILVLFFISLLQNLALAELHSTPTEGSRKISNFEEVMRQIFAENARKQALHGSFGHRLVKFEHAIVQFLPSSELCPTTQILISFPVDAHDNPCLLQSGEMFYARICVPHDPQTGLMVENHTVNEVIIGISQKDGLGFGAPYLPLTTVELKNLGGPQDKISIFARAIPLHYEPSPNAPLPWPSFEGDYWLVGTVTKIHFCMPP